MKHSTISKLFLTAAVISLSSGGVHAQETVVSQEENGTPLQDGESDSLAKVALVESAQDDAEISSLLDLPFEDLLSLESTSVAKKRQRVQDSAAAVFVITQEDIRRSPANSIPDLLRMVPGLEVGNQGTGATAVSVRGFNSRLSNSLLVMIDGRSLYVSTFSGVFWDQLLLPLGDIERIEIVRGPGASLWGANAVNGVINIITKHSSNSLGTSLDARASIRDQEVNLSHSGRISDTMSYRLYGTYRHEDGLVDVDGEAISDRWVGYGAGARLDWEPSERDAFTLQAEFGDGSFDNTFESPNTDLLNPGYVTTKVQNGFENYNVLARWARQQSETLDWTLQAHYDFVDRREFSGPRLVWKQGDVDFGLHWQASDVHDFNFGIGGRFIDDIAYGGPSLQFEDFPRPDKWISGYVQDDISLIPDTLRLTLGAKVEHNNFTGFEFQPSAKLFFRPSKSVAMWGGVSRAVRTPSRFERSAHLSLSVELPGTLLNPTALPIYTRLNGSEETDSERLTAYEAGLRIGLPESWSLDVATYYNRYKHLTTIEMAGTTPLFVTPIPYPVGLLVDMDFLNNGTAQTWGVEIALSGHIKPWWKVDLSYSHFDYKVELNPVTEVDTRLLFALNGSPTDQLSIRSAIDIGDRLAVDAQVRYVSSILDGSVPSYFGADLRLTYRPLDSLELSLIAENFATKRHAEFTQPSYLTPLAYTPRTVSAEARIRF